MNNLQLKFIFLFLLFSQLGFSQTASEWFDKGYIATNNKQFESAIEYFDKAIELNPNYTLAYFSRGFSKLNLMEFQEAIFDFDKTIQLTPNNALAYSLRGFCKLNLEKHKEAIADFKKVLSFEPNNNLVKEQIEIAQSELAKQQKKD